MNKVNFLFSLLFSVMITIPLKGQKGMEYYLPEGQYDPSIPTPSDILGYNPGDWHVGHDQLLIYLKAIAAASDRVEITEYARSHEHRPLVNLIISDPTNLSNLEAIRKEHLKLTDPSVSNKVDISSLPAVLYQGYSIHGNESSGANAALVNAYYLAAGQSNEVLNTLKNTVIILDPCYNPDGLNRFASWANTHKSKTLVSDPLSRELNEVWPRGRTNHYWFDLNRDWLLLTHPESQGRIKVFHEWRPNVLTDHHEMGTNSTFFFQPGIPSRTNPNTPQLNQDLTEKIGTYHAAALDSIGSLYYTKASFDDFYYGKGSTYPDANGCIGILFEQASSRGHLQESVNGTLSFPFTIRNQFVTSVSTQKATAAMREELLIFKRDFYKKQKKAAQASKIKGYVISDKDKVKLSNFHRILSAHKVDMFALNQDVSLNGKTYKKDDAFYVPMEQNQYLMVKTIFEKVRTFPDSLFYDVSAWTLPLAFDLTYSEVTSAPKIGAKVTSMKPKGNLHTMDDAYAFILDWKSYNAPAALFQVMDKGLRTMVINKSFSIPTEIGDRQFNIGDVVIPVQGQKLSLEEIKSSLKAISEAYSVDFYGVKTGWADNNMTLGNPEVDILEQPSVAMIVGEGVTSYDIELITCSDTTGWPQDSCFGLIIPFPDTLGDLILVAEGFGVPPYSYSWSTGDTTQSIQAPDSGIVCVTITDAMGCAIETCLDVSGPGGWGGHDSCFAAITCDSAGNLVALGFGEPDFTYIWSTGDTTETISPPDTGEYCVTITDATGCVAEACTFVHGPDTTGWGDSCFAFILPAPTGTGQLSLIGEGFGIPPYTFIWSTGDTSQIIQAPDTGVVCVTITDANGCVAESCIDVEDLGGWGGPDSCYAEIGCTAAGDLVAIGFGQPDFTYLWSTGDTTESISPPDTGLYCVTITDATGCEAEACTYVHGGGIDTTGSDLILGYAFLDSVSSGDLESVVIEFYIDNNGTFELERSVDAEMDGPFPFFVFEAQDLPFGSYIIKAIPTSADNKALPTYFGDTDVWDDATILDYQGGLSVIGIQILEKTGLQVHGKGSIAGSLIDQSGFIQSGSENGSPMVNAPILLKDEYGDILEIGWTDQLGEFRFEGLAEGLYKLTFDVINMASDEIEVYLNSGEEKNINWEIKNSTTSVLDDPTYELMVVPNPAVDRVWVQLDEEMMGGQLHIMSLSGKTVLSVLIESSEQMLDISHLSSGMYLATFRKDDQNLNIKIFKQ